MDFPHLNETAFPGLPDTVYDYANTFDYSRWTPGTEVTLATVPWDKLYNHVVDWTENDIDVYIDSRPDALRLTIDNMLMLNPDGDVVLPVPYDRARRYNYARVTIPPFTPDGQPLNYAPSGSASYYFFLEDITYRSPSATELRLTLDEWTNYQGAVTIEYMRLGRGHYPVVKSSVSSLFDNPIENSALLLHPDEEGAPTLTQKSGFIQYGTGELYVIFVSPVSPTSSGTLGDIPGGAYDGSITPPTFSNNSARWGYQYNISDAWGFSPDVTGIRTPTGNVKSRGAYLDSLNYWATPASSFTGDATKGFFNRVPHFARTIQAAFLIPASLINLSSETYSLGGLTWRVASPKTASVDINPTPADFDLIPSLANFAKAYTGQYSQIELSDNNGARASFALENMSKDVRLRAQALFTYPSLKVRAFLEGVDGDGDALYTVQRINGTANKTLTANGLDSYLSDYDIPTFSIFVDAARLAQIDNARSIENQRASAHLAYHNGQRSMNTGSENSDDSAATARTNALASNRTVRNNIENNINLDSQVRVRARNSATFINENSFNYMQSAAVESAHMSELQVQTDNELMYKTVATENMARTICSVMDGLEGIVGGGLSGGAAGAGGASLSFLSNQVQNAVQIQASKVITDAQALANLTKQAIVSTHQIGGWVPGRPENPEYFPGAAKVNAEGSKGNIGIGNIMDAMDEIEQHETQRTNSDNTKTNADANTNRTYNTSVANSAYSQEASTLNNQETLRVAQENALRSYQSGLLQAPAEVAPAGGDTTRQALEVAGVQIRYKVPTRAAQSRLAATFGRYGYRLSQPVEVESLSLLPSYTYWEAEEVWLSPADPTATEAHIDALKFILESGVTVWSSPEKCLKGRN